MNIALFAKNISPDNFQYISLMLRKLKQAGCGILIYENLFAEIAGLPEMPDNAQIFNTHDEIKNVDFLFSIGGDGTLLDTVRLVRDSGIPVMGVNTGRLGFLSSIAKDQIEHAIDLLLTKQYTIDRRTLLKVESENNLFSDLNYALNEMTILKKDSSSMITIHAYINYEYLNSYWADGLIISTPTGSTAYSLSCGGPILLPETSNFIITPIAPHNLNVRPIVLPDNNILTFRVEGRVENYLVSLDSRAETIDQSVELTVKKHDFVINLVKLKDMDFLKTIRTKLMWGLDRRN